MNYSKYIGHLYFKDFGTSFVFYLITELNANYIDYKGILYSYNRFYKKLESGYSYSLIDRKTTKIKIIKTNLTEKTALEFINNYIENLIFE